MRFDYQLDKYPSEITWRGGKQLFGHRTAFTNDQNPYPIVNLKKGPAWQNLKQFKLENQRRYFR